MKRSCFLAVSMMIAVSLPAFAGAVQNISFIQLLVNPTSFNGKGISVSGVLHKNRYGNWCLYPNIESSQVEIDRDSFMLIFDNKYEDKYFINKQADLRDKYVLVYGVVDTNPPQPSLYAGIIKRVDGIKTYPLIKSLPSASTQ